MFCLSIYFQVTKLFRPQMHLETYLNTENDKQEPSLPVTPVPVLTLLSLSRGLTSSPPAPLTRLLR